MKGDPVLSRCECGAEVRRPPEGERPRPMEHGLLDGVSCVLAYGTPCAWCTGPMFTTSPKARCCSKRCKAALWKHEHRYGHQKQRKQCSYTKSSGLQLAYGKTYDELVDHFISRGEPYPEVLARKILSVGLSARQRELLAQRSTERKAAA